MDGGAPTKRRETARAVSRVAVGERERAAADRRVLFSARQLELWKLPRRERKGGRRERVSGFAPGNSCVQERKTGGREKGRDCCPRSILLPARFAFSSFHLLLHLVECGQLQLMLSSRTRSPSCIASFVFVLLLPRQSLTVPKRITRSRRGATDYWIRDQLRWQALPLASDE